jgi:ribonuclease P protein component
VALPTLKDRHGFRRVMTRGKVARSNGLRVHFALNGLPHSRYGIAATTAVGGAVVRNRVRRWAKELLRRWDELLAPGYDLVVFVNQREASSSSSTSRSTWPRRCARPS